MRAAIKEEGSDKVKEGKWSMLYDQGLIIFTEDIRLFSNFKYTLKSNYKRESQI